MAHVKAQSALMDGKRYWPGEGVVPKSPNGCQALPPPLPVGLTYDAEAFPEMARWADPSGGIMHVWR